MKCFYSSLLLCSSLMWLQEQVWEPLLPSTYNKLRRLKLVIPYTKQRGWKYCIIVQHTVFCSKCKLYILIFFFVKYEMPLHELMMEY